MNIVFFSSGYEFPCSDMDIEPLTDMRKPVLSFLTRQKHQLDEYFVLQTKLDTNVRRSIKLTCKLVLVFTHYEDRELYEYNSVTVWNTASSGLPLETSWRGLSSYMRANSPE